MTIREVIDMMYKNGQFVMARVVENLNKENTMLVTQLVDSEQRNDELGDKVEKLNTELVDKTNTLRSIRNLTVFYGD